MVKTNDGMICIQENYNNPLYDHAHHQTNHHY